MTGQLIDKTNCLLRPYANSLEEMKNAIWAILYHKISSDKEPQDDKCPHVVDPRRSSQKAKEKNILEMYSRDPHPKEAHSAIRPVYERFGSFIGTLSGRIGTK